MTKASTAQLSSMLLILTFALLAAVCYLPNMVAAGAVFEPAKPIFKSPKDYKLVFKGPPTSKGAPKPPVVLRSPSSSPFVGSILQLATITIEPCGVIGAHIHPRATEHLVVIKGSIEIGMHFENGATLLVPVKAGEGAVITQGTIHFVRNAGCTKVELVAAFDSPNAGAVFAGEALLKFPASYLKSAFSSIKGPAPNLFFSKSCACKKG